MIGNSEAYPVRRLDSRSFDETVREGILLLDLDEPSCGPCRMQLAILKKLAPRFGPEVTVAEMNIDEAPECAMRYHVESIPTVLLFKDGKLVRRFAGIQREARLARAVQEAVTAG